jgi:heptosyltransferase-3
VELGLTPLLPTGAPRCIDLCGKLSPIETAEVIARAEAFVGVESGPAHLANAVRTPSVILMGRYKSFGHYMPYTGFLRENECSMLLRSPTLPCDLTVEAVADRTRQVLEANPLSRSKSE